MKMWHLCSLRESFSGRSSQPSTCDIFDIAVICHLWSGTLRLRTSFQIFVTTRWGMSCLEFFVSWFGVLFWKLTLLSFQVTCPSSCVTGLTSSLIPDCFHLCSPPHVYIVFVFACPHCQSISFVPSSTSSLISQPCLDRVKYCQAFVFCSSEEERFWFNTFLVSLLFVSGQFNFIAFSFSSIWSVSDLYLFLHR